MVYNGYHWNAEGVMAESQISTSGYSPNHQSQGTLMEEDTAKERPLHPHPMEFGSMPLDPMYAWGIVLEPVETLIERTSAFIEQLAREALERGEPLDDDDEELEQRFLAFFDQLVEEGTLTRLPDADPAMGRRILGPRRWLRAQRIRINRLAAHWRAHGGSDA
jgi:hypothetical protein